MKSGAKIVLGMLFIAMVSFVLVPQLALSPVTMVVSAQEQASAKAGANVTANVTYQVVLAKALILREMLSKALMLNISDELRSEISSLLAVNLSKLSIDGLREWIANASKALASVGEEARAGGRAYAVGVVLQRFLNGIRIAVENRVREVEKKYNVTIPIEDILANMSRARDIREFNMYLAEIRKRLEYEKMQRFANMTLSIASAELSKGTVKSLEDASKHLEIAVAILNRTIEKLEKANVSESAIQALKLAVSKVAEARNIVANISKQIAVEKPANITKAIRKAIENKTEEALEELEEIENELQNLRNISLEANLTWATKQIDTLLKRVEELKQRIANGSADDPARWMLELVEIKAVVKMLRESIKKLPEALPARNVDKAYNATIDKAKKLLNTVKSMLSYVENKSKAICIAIYPPPPACIFHNQMLIKQINDTITTAENLINEAEKQYSLGNKVTALILANRAYAMLEMAKAWLEPLYNMVTEGAEGRTAPAKTASLEVKEAKLEHIKGWNYRLVVDVKNNGNNSIKILSVSILTPRSMPIPVNKVVEPGSEETITANVMIMQPLAEGSVEIAITTSTGETLIASAEVEQ